MLSFILREMRSKALVDAGLRSERHAGPGRDAHSEKAWSPCPRRVATETPRFAPKRELGRARGPSLLGPETTTWNEPGKGPPGSCSQGRAQGPIRLWAEESLSSPSTLWRYRAVRGDSERRDFNIVLHSAGELSNPQPILPPPPRPFVLIYWGRGGHTPPPTHNHQIP